MSLHSPPFLAAVASRDLRASAAVAARPIRLDPWRLPLMLLGCALLLVGAYVVTQLWVPRVLHGQGGTLAMIQFFDLDREGNLPSWFSATLWTLAAALAFGASAQGHADRRARPRWLALGGLYLFLSMDEMAGWHDMLGIVLRRAPGAAGTLHYAWLIYGMILLAVAGLYFAPFVLRLPRYVAGCIGLAATVYVGAAAGLEFLGGKVRDGVLAYPFGLTGFHEIIGEEFGEMLGVIILIHGLIVFLRGNDGRGGFAVQAGARA